MGISLDQYRASIGRWAAGRMKRLLPAPAPLQPDLPSKEETQTLGPILHGPWKLHAAILIIWITLIGLLIGTTPKWCPSVPNGPYHEAIMAAHASDCALTAGGLISHQCLTALLLMSGVEPNPGPDDQDQHTEIVAGLCTGAPSTEIRECLRLHNPQNNIKQHRTEFGRCSKSVLVATLDYLRVPGQDLFNKPACINILISRIQNLLPDQCNICKQSYCVKLEEVPLLECALCGQGSHNSCILDLFGVLLAEQDNFGPEEAKTKINPVGLPGLHYLCGACENDIIPDKETGLLKRGTAHSRQESISSHNALVLGSTSQDDDSDQPQSPDEEAAVVDAQQSDPENSDEPEYHSGNHNPVDHQADDTTHGRNSNSRQAGERDTRIICPYYRQGTCKHGHKGRQCPKDHTPACRRPLKHGNKGPQGCTQGRSCTNFHPRMCSSSLAKRQCFKADCKLKHVAHTVRVPMTSELEWQTHQEGPRNLLWQKLFFRGSEGHEGRHHAGTEPETASSSDSPSHGYSSSLPRALAIPNTHTSSTPHSSVANGSTTIPSNVHNVAWRTSSRRSDARSSRRPHRRHSADGAGANATPLATFSVFNVQGLKPRTVPSKVPFLKDLLHQEKQLFIALSES